LPHRFSASLQHLEAYGVFNAGWIYWRNDARGRRAVADWRDDCLSWCGETAEPDGRFMNQGYLTSWPQRYAGVHVIRHPGVNLAPWNVAAHRLGCDAGAVTVDGKPLVFYHFSGMVRDPAGRWFSTYPFECQIDLLCSAIYHPYIRAVEAERRRLLQQYGIDGTGSVRASPTWQGAFEFTLPEEQPGASSPG